MKYYIFEWHYHLKNTLDAWLTKLHTLFSAKTILTVEESFWQYEWCSLHSISFYQLGTVETIEDSLSNLSSLLWCKETFLYKLPRYLAMGSVQGYYLYLFNSQYYDRMIFETDYLNSKCFLFWISPHWSDC